jgi:two-component system sensor histidine kinase ChvG
MKISIHSYKKILGQFKLITIKNVTKDDSNIGYIAITENANDIKIATDEEKSFCS